MSAQRNARIAIAVGHGGPLPGAVNGNFIEKNLNLTVALELRRLLQAQGHTVIMNRTTDIDGTEAAFAQRINNDNIDFAIAVHFNAFNRSAHGFEVFANRGAVHRPRSLLLSREIEKAVRAAIPQLHSRGVKDSNFAMNNNSYPCAYLEGCFLDSPTDQRFIDTTAKLNTFAKAYADGIRAWCTANGFRVTPQPAVSAPTPTPAPTPATTFRVVAGSFTNRANAEARLAEVRGRGFTDAFITSV